MIKININIPKMVKESDIEVNINISDNNEVSVVTSIEDSEDPKPDLPIIQKGIDPDMTDFNDI